VEFVRSKAEQRTLYLSLGGRSEAEVAPVSFGAAGKVTTLPVKEGAFVDAGSLLCGLEGHGVVGRVKQAEAAVARAREAHTSNVSRLAEGWVSQARVKQSKAALDEAVTALEIAKTEVAQRQAGGDRSVACSRSATRRSANSLAWAPRAALLCGSTRSLSSLAHPKSRR